MGVTPSSQIAMRACTRVFVGGFTFRLAKGDTRIAIWPGVCIEQHRVFIRADVPFPGPVREGPLAIGVTIPKPDKLDWADGEMLTAVAWRWVSQVGACRR
ncbi:hypothetical protein [Actinokineospora spheciospongiae]|uniref:hypothetical protein n=1 Tax=Actinokineospora spheciospongiae TaxID=909613 RepID=UPI001267D56E|nr:hypothetical protein [Actinokineospora spheciospongiae]